MDNNPQRLVWKYGPLTESADDAKKDGTVAETARRIGSTEPKVTKNGNEVAAGFAKKGGTVTETVRNAGTTAMQELNSKKKGNEAVATPKARTSNTSSSSREAILSTSRVDAKELSKHVRTLRERIYRTGAPVRLIKLLNDVCTSYGVRSLDELGLRIENVDELRDLRQLEGLVEMQVMISKHSLIHFLYDNKPIFTLSYVLISPDCGLHKCEDYQHTV